MQQFIEQSKAQSSVRTWWKYMIHKSIQFHTVPSKLRKHPV